MSKLEVAIGTDDPTLRKTLADMDKLSPLDKMEIMGPLLIHIGTMWVRDSGIREGRKRAFAHNRRKP